VICSDFFFFSDFTEGVGVVVFFFEYGENEDLLRGSSLFFPLDTDGFWRYLSRKLKWGARFSTNPF